MLQALRQGTGREPDRSRALTALLVNQLATPGLGSILAGRRAVGTAQLLLAVAGFALVAIWFARVLLIYYGLVGEEAVMESPDLQHELWQVGAALFGAAWLWALATSVGLLRRARRAEAELSQPRMPPVIGATRR